MRLTTNGSGRFFEKFLQKVGRNDPNDTPLERYRRDATFSCRTPPLIHYGLRAVLKLQKHENSVFRDTQIDAFFCASELHVTATQRTVNCMFEKTVHVVFSVPFLL